MTNELMECDRQAGRLILSVQGTGVVSVIRYTRFINLIYLFIYLFIPLFSNFFFIFFPREVAMSHYRAERDFVLCRSSDLFRLGAFVRRKKRFSAVEIKKKKKKRIQKKKQKRRNKKMKQKKCIENNEYRFNLWKIFRAIWTCYHASLSHPLSRWFAFVLLYLSPTFRSHFS